MMGSSRFWRILDRIIHSHNIADALNPFNTRLKKTSADRRNYDIKTRRAKVSVQEIKKAAAGDEKSAAESQQDINVFDPTLLAPTAPTIGTNVTSPAFMQSPILADGRDPFLRLLGAASQNPREGIPASGSRGLIETILNTHSRIPSLGDNSDIEKKYRELLSSLLDQLQTPVTPTIGAEITGTGKQAPAVPTGGTGVVGTGMQSPTTPATGAATAAPAVTHLSSVVPGINDIPGLDSKNYLQRVLSSYPKNPSSDIGSDLKAKILGLLSSAPAQSQTPTPSSTAVGATNIPSQVLATPATGAAGHTLGAFGAFVPPTTGVAGNTLVVPVRGGTNILEPIIRGTPAPFVPFAGVANSALRSPAQQTTAQPTTGTVDNTLRSPTTPATGAEVAGGGVRQVPATQTTSTEPTSPTILPSNFDSISYSLGPVELGVGSGNKLFAQLNRDRVNTQRQGTEPTSPTILPSNFDSISYSLGPVELGVGSGNKLFAQLNRDRVNTQHQGANTDTVTSNTEQQATNAGTGNVTSIPPFSLPYALGAMRLSHDVVNKAWTDLDKRYDIGNKLMAALKQNYSNLNAHNQETNTVTPNTGQQTTNTGTSNEGTAPPIPASLMEARGFPAIPGYSAYRFRHNIDRVDPSKVSQVFGEFEKAIDTLARDKLGYTSDDEINNLITSTRQAVGTMRGIRGPAHAILGQTEKGTLALAKDKNGNYYFLLTDPSTSQYAAYFGGQENAFRNLGPNVMGVQQPDQAQSSSLQQFDDQSWAPAQSYFDPSQFAQLAMMMALINPQQAMNMLMSMYMMNYMTRMMQQRGFGVR